MRRLLSVQLLATVLAILFFFLCGGVFLARGAGGEAWKVTTTRTDAAASGSETEEEWPVSLLPGERIDLNTAAAKDLARLPQIGEKRAQDIVTWREEHGPFCAPEDVMNVSGIGEGIFAQIEGYITVDEIK